MKFVSNTSSGFLFLACPLLVSSQPAFERARSFRAMTRLPRVEEDQPEEQEIQDSQGNRYKRKNLRVQTTTAGAVSLTEGSEYIEDVTCTSNPSTITVTIKDGKELDANELNELFPTGSNIIVKGEVFGDCNLGQETPNYENYPHQPAINGYLLVDSVQVSDGQQSQRQVIRILGEATSWWSSFDVLQFEIERDEHERRRRNLKTWNGRGLQDGCDSDSSDNLVDGDLSTLPLNILGVNFASVGANVCVDIKDSGLDSYKVDVSMSRAEIVVTTVLNIQTEASLAFSFLEFDGAIDEVCRRIFNPVKIAPLPEVLSVLDRFGALDTDLFGLYFDVSLLINGWHALSNNLDYTTKIGYHTGRKVTEFFAGTTGVGVRRVSDEDGSGIHYEFDTDTVEDAHMDSTLFIGVQPAISFYSESLFAGVRLDFGTQGDIDWMGRDVGYPYPAIASGLRNNACESAHQFETKGYLLARNLAADFDVGLSILDVFEFSDSLTFPIINELLDLSIGTVCSHCINCTNPDSGDGRPDNCYSPHATAMVEDKGKVAMKDLNVGDNVLTASGQYRPVYTISHFHHTKPANFLQIHTELEGDESALELTPMHLVYMEGKGDPVPAIDVKIGDCLQTHKYGPQRVNDITLIQRNGLYNPITTDGTMIVDGIVTSSYTSFTGSAYLEIAGMELISIHNLLKITIGPYRAFCMSTSSLNLCNQHGEDELPIVVQLMEKFYGLWSKQNVPVQFAIISIYVFIFGFMDFLSEYAVYVFAAAVGWLLAGRRNSGNKIAKKS